METLETHVIIIPNVATITIKIHEITSIKVADGKISADIPQITNAKKILILKIIAISNSLR